MFMLANAFANVEKNNLILELLPVVVTPISSVLSSRLFSWVNSKVISAEVKKNVVTGSIRFHPKLFLQTYIQRIT